MIGLSSPLGFSWFLPWTRVNNRRGQDAEQERSFPSLSVPRPDDDEARFVQGRSGSMFLHVSRWQSSAPGNDCQRDAVFESGNLRLPWNGWNHENQAFSSEV